MILPSRMKNPAPRLFLLILACLFFCGRTVSAQVRLPSFDESFRTMKFNAVGDLHYGIDDYTQYAPAALTLGLKICGYDSRSSWGRMAVSDAFSVAVMTAVVNGVKYTVRRPRPDGTSDNSFPSGHTATSFMTAAMLHEEYGWRSPWFSFGGYAIAAATGISRVINDRHWMSDVIAGAVIGTASVKLGYWLADLIFKDRYLNEAWDEPRFGFDISRKYYDIGLYTGYRFFLGMNGKPHLTGGGTSGIEASIPVSNSDALKGTAGVALRAGVNSCIASDIPSFNTYDCLAGGYWRRPFAGILEADTRLLVGYSFVGNRQTSATAGILDGLALSAECGLAITTGENFKIKAFAAYEAVRFTVRKPLVHSIVLGGTASFFW